MEKLDLFKRALSRGVHSGTTKKVLRSVTIEEICRIVQQIAEKTDLTREGVENYLDSLHKKGDSPNTLNKYIDAIRHWARYVNDEDLLKIPRYQKVANYKATMSAQELRDFVALPPAKNGPKTTYALWTFYFVLLIETGGRSSEIATLTVDQVDFGQNVFILDKTKTEPRDLAFPEKLAPIIQEHVKKLTTDNLFPPEFANRFIRNSVFKRRLKRLGIKRKGLSPHSLRHSFGTRMVTEISLPELQGLMGHKRIETTAVYLHLSKEQIRKSIKKDPYNRSNLSYVERFNQWREIVRGGLSTFATSPDEERQMLRDLVGLV